MRSYQTAEYYEGKAANHQVASYALACLGVLIVACGVPWAASNASSQYSVAQAAVRTALHPGAQQVATHHNQQAVAKDEAFSPQDAVTGHIYKSERQGSPPASWPLRQQILAVCVSSVLGAAASWAFRKKASPGWAMAAIEEKPEVLVDDAEDDALLPSLDEVLAARQEFLRLKGKGPGAHLEPGEVLRPVNFPGEKEPVDLVEMYRRFEELLGETVKRPVVGTRVTGTVFDIDERGASIDYGGKNIGFCPLEELALCRVRRPEDVVQPGMQREFEILASPRTRRRDEDEFTLLSLKAIAEQVAWERLQQYRENDITFPVVLKGKNRGGYMLEVQDLGIPGFLPKSQAVSDLATAPETVDPTLYMDQEVDVKVLDLDPERKRLVVSQRAANPKMATDTFKMGTVHEGIVQNVKPYGVFVDVNGMSGLLHISQISNSRIENVEAIFKVGDKIKCMVLSQDPVQGRLALSTKRLEPTHGDMLTNPQLVYEKAEEMAERFRADIAAAEKRMQEFEAKLAEQNTVALG